MPNHGTLADQALVERAQHGDQQAFGALVSKYQAPLSRMLSRFVKDSHEAQDVAQEAFIRAFRALPRFRGESAFFTWLYAIGVNSARNHLIRKKRRPPTSSDYDNVEAESFDDNDQLRELNTPETLMISKQVGAALEAAVEALPPDLKATLTLREVDGLSYEEIAHATHCPVGTVRSRLFRAREALTRRVERT